MDLETRVGKLYETESSLQRAATVLTSVGRVSE